MVNEYGLSEQDELELMEMSEDRLEELAEEIRGYSVIILDSAIKIGKRFTEAKELCTRGKWGEWVKEATGYEQSMAENYMKIYREYGGGQLNLGGDFTKSQSIASLGVTKLLELTKIPAEERESFVLENNITDSTTVKELKEKIKALESEKETEMSEKEDEISSLKDELKEAGEQKEKYENEILKLNGQIEELLKNPPETPMEKMQNDSELESLKKTVEKLEKEKNKISEKAEKASEKLKSAEEKQKAAENEAENLKQKLKSVEEALSKEKAKASGNESITKINILFSNVQHELDELISVLDTSRDFENLKTKICMVLAQKIGASYEG